MNATDKSLLFLHYWNILSPLPRPELQPEYCFALPRKWRFDWAFLPPFKLAIEIEGNAWHVAGGGRHMGDKDLDKYNHATLEGWRVLRFSPGMIERDPQACIDMVRKALGV